MKHALQTSQWLVAALLGMSMLALLVPGSADAAVVGCRGDPVIPLSDGRTLDVVVNIDANASDVNTITYTVHVPPGVSAGLIVKTSLPIGPKETVVVVQDGQAGQYTVDTLVNSTVENANVVASGTAIRLVPPVVNANSASGETNGSVTYTLARP